MGTFVWNLDPAASGWRYRTFPPEPSPCGEAIIYCGGTHILVTLRNERQSRLIPLVYPSSPNSTALRCAPADPDDPAWPPILDAVEARLNVFQGVIEAYRRLIDPEVAGPSWEPPGPGWASLAGARRSGSLPKGF